VNKVFCIPGRNETLSESFAWLLRRKQVEIIGVDFNREFSTMTFAGQVDWCRGVIRDSLLSNDLILGRSFGAWIILNALVDPEENYPGTVILIASVLGYGRSGNVGFIAPRAKSFWREAASRQVSPAQRIVLIHATNDDQCPLEYAEKLSRIWGLDLVTFKKGGHGLGKENALQKELAGVVQEIWHPASVG